PLPRSSPLPYTTLFRSADFHRLVEEGAVKHPVEERDHRPVGRTEIDGAGDDHAVGRFKFGGGLVHQVVKDTFALLFAAQAADTSDRKSTRLNSSHVSIS